MYCENCGKEVAQGAMFCPNCGQRIMDGAQDAGKAIQGQKTMYANGNVDGAQYSHGVPTGGVEGQGNSDSHQTQYSNQYQQPNKSSVDGFAIASLVLGIVSFFFVPLIGAILAIVFGNKSIRDNGMNTVARVGKILGIISLVLWCIIVVVYIVLIVVGFGLIGMGY